MVVWRRELGEVENECTSHNFSFFAIFLPKIIKIGGKLRKFWQKQFCTVFLRHGAVAVPPKIASLNQTYKRVSDFFKMQDIDDCDEYILTIEIYGKLTY